MNMRATFPSAARLLRPSDFTVALKGRRIARGALLVLIAARPEAPLDIPQARLGIIVGKRNARLAVTRNTIKRILREEFRQIRHELPHKDYIFRLHSSTGKISLKKLKKAIRTEAIKHLERARKC